MEKSDFNKLPLTSRLAYVRSHGKFLATRQYASYIIHLYQTDNFFVEAWMKIAFNELAWIEITSTGQIAENYMASGDLLKELGL